MQWIIWLINRSFFKTDIPVMLDLTFRCLFDTVPVHAWGEILLWEDHVTTV